MWSSIPNSVENLVSLSVSLSGSGSTLDYESSSARGRICDACGGGSVHPGDAACTAPDGLKVRWKISPGVRDRTPEKYTGGGGYFPGTRQRRERSPLWEVQKQRLSWLEQYPEVIELEWLSSVGTGGDA